jgi:hypothetical protein
MAAHVDATGRMRRLAHPTCCNGNKDSIMVKMDNSHDGIRA